MRRATVLRLILALAIIGLAVAGYQTYEHYAQIDSDVCDLGEQFSCSVVTESRYGEFPPQSGIALSAWGVLWWLSVIVLTATMLYGVEFLPMQEFALFADLVFGALTALYLIAVELYFLPQLTGEIVICPLCTVQHVLMFVVLGAGYTLLEQPLDAYLEAVFYTEVDSDG